MSLLTDELKKEHATILQVLSKVGDLGISSQEGQRLLISARKELLYHLNKEDTRLYPGLNKAAETDADLKRTLETFAKDLAEVSQNAMDFFAKYDQGDSGLEFARDFGRLVGTLRARISREEMILYKEFDELQ